MAGEGPSPYAVLGLENGPEATPEQIKKVNRRDCCWEGCGLPQCV